MKILILGSGGDAPGMNTCIYYLTKYLTKYEVYACRYGYQGILDKKFEKITLKETEPHMDEAGIFIKSSRCPKFKTEEGINLAIKNLNEFNVGYLIVLGGDGSFKGAKKLTEKGIKVIFIPSTIDQDMPFDTYTMGFNTAAIACVNYINNVRPTFQAFDRTGIFEVMGRHDPDLANLVGELVNADLIINQDNMNNIAYKKFNELHKKNPNRTVILQENTIPINELVEAFSTMTNGEVRSCVVGYIQRGTAPTKLEKFYCKQFAKYAKKAIELNLPSSAIAICEEYPRIILFDKINV